MPHWGTISGVVLIFIGVILVGIGQRVNNEVGSVYTVMRRRVVALRRQLAGVRSRRRNPIRPDRQRTMPLDQAGSDVARVVAQLQQGRLTDMEKGQLAAALSSQAVIALPQEREAAPQEADVTEALDLATVASSAVKRVGERDVLAMRFIGIAMVILGIGITVLGLRYP